MYTPINEKEAASKNGPKIYKWRGMHWRRRRRRRKKVVCKGNTKDLGKGRIKEKNDCFLPRLLWTYHKIFIIHAGKIQYLEKRIN